MRTSVAARLVRVAAATLPSGQRLRYREQWLADLRDARAVGIRQAQIVVGSLVFAVCVRRSLPHRRTLDATGIGRRGRIARTLALTAGTIGVSDYVNFAGYDSLTQDTVLDAVAFAVSSFPLLFAAIAAICSLVLAIGTRGLPLGDRVSVLLFLTAATAPAFRTILDAVPTATWSPWASPGDLAFVGALVLIVVGLALRRAPMIAAPARKPVLAITSGLCVLGIASAMIVNAMVLWANRSPLKFSGPRTQSNSAYVEWSLLKQFGESMVASAFGGWIAAAAVFVMVFVAIGMRFRLSARETAISTTLAVALALIASAGLLGYLQLMESGIVPVPERSLTLGLGRTLLVLVSIHYVRAAILNPEVEQSGVPSKLAASEG